MMPQGSWLLHEPFYPSEELLNWMIYDHRHVAHSSLLIVCVCLHASLSPLTPSLSPSRFLCFFFRLSLGQIYLHLFLFISPGIPPPFFLSLGSSLHDFSRSCTTLFSVLKIVILTQLSSFNQVRRETIFGLTTSKTCNK